jgi:dihydroorotate dehydrogenase
VKIAPDLTLNELDDVVAVTRRRTVDGMIVGNTTVARPRTLREAKLAREAGGLSGKPLFGVATRMLAETFVRVENQFPLIGSGGIDSGTAALAKMRAGANLVQLYSALVFRGLGLVGEIKDELINALERGEARTLADLVGLDAADITAHPWPAV